MKKAVLILCVLCLALATACQTPGFLYGEKYSVFKQANSEWASDEYDIRIISHENSQAEMIMTLNGEEMSYSLKHVGDTLYTVDESEAEVVRWSVHYYKDKIRLTVDESDMFKSGTVIILDKVD